MNEVVVPAGMDLQALLNRIAEETSARRWQERPIGYIEPLLHEPIAFSIGVRLITPGTFGTRGVAPQGEMFLAGSTDLARTIQSCGKPLIASLAMHVDGEGLWRYAGDDATHHAFNDVGHLQKRRGVPWHPFGNPGAIRCACRLRELEDDPQGAWLQFIHGQAANPGAWIDQVMAEAERATCNRNLAAAYLMKEQGNFPCDVPEAVGLYCDFCSTRVTTMDMLNLYTFLGNRGIGTDGEQVLRWLHTQQMLQVLGDTGAYEQTTGLMRMLAPLEPVAVKTAVSGYMAVVCQGDRNRGGMVIVVCDPRLNGSGNSAPGIHALRLLADAFAEAKGM